MKRSTNVFPRNPFMGLLVKDSTVSKCIQVRWLMTMNPPSTLLCDDRATELQYRTKLLHQSESIKWDIRRNYFSKIYHEPFDSNKPLLDRTVGSGMRQSSGKTHIENTGTVYQDKVFGSSELEQYAEILISKSIGSWDRKDVAMVRSILAELLSREHKRVYTNKQELSADLATQLLTRWMVEYLNGKELIRSMSIGTGGKNQDGHELVNILHRVLHSWRICKKERNVNRYSGMRSSNSLSEMNLNYRHHTSDDAKLSKSSRKAVELLQFFYESDLKQQENSGNQKRGVMFISEKAYSMIFEMLASEIAHFPGVAHHCLETSEVLIQQVLTSFPRPMGAVIWNSYLHLLAQASLEVLESPEKVEEIVLQAISASDGNSERIFHPDRKTYSIALHAWSKCPRRDAPERALQLFDSIQKKDSSNLDSACYNQCILSLGQAGRGKDAEDLLWKINQIFVENSSKTETNMGCIVRPDHLTFLAVINSWSKNKEPERAKILLEQMISLQQNNPLYRDWLFPTTEIYTAVMDAYANHRKDSGPLVEAVLKEMEGSLHSSRAGSKHNTGSSCKPSPHTYTAAIRAWAKSSTDPTAPERAEAIVQRMIELSERNRNVAPNTITYTALIQAWASNTAREDGADKALTIFREMAAASRKNRQVVPNTITFNSVLGAFAIRGLAKEAFELLVDVMENEIGDVKPNSNSWTTVLQGYARSKLPDAGIQALEVLRQMESSLDQSRDANQGSYTISPTSRPYVATIVALGKCGFFSEAEGVIWHMQSRYETGISTGRAKWVVPPDTDVCNAVLKGWSVSNEPIAPARAEMIWKWMDEQVKNGKKYLQPNATTIQKVVSIWGNSGLLSKTERIQALKEEIRIKYPQYHQHPQI